MNPFGPLVVEVRMHGLGIDERGTVHIHYEIVEDILQPLDIPRPGTDCITARIFCTPDSVRKAVLDKRQQFSETVSSMIIDHLMKRMALKDTENGYPKDA